MREINHKTFAPAACALSILLAAAATGAAADKEQIVWKPYDYAVLRIDDRPAKMWNVYRAEKRDGVYLIQLGLRFLMLDGREKKVFELAPEKLTKKGKDLVFNEADLPKEPLETSDWIVRDVGPAMRYKVHLDHEGRDVDLQITLGPNGRPVK